MRIILVNAIVGALLILLLSSCEQPAPVKTEVEVVVQEVKQYPFQGSNAFVGRLEAIGDVEIIARVKAPVQQVHFQQGAQVSAGDLLYSLNQDELQAQYDQVQASVSQATSALAVAKKNYDRGVELAPDGYISGSELDQLESNVLEAKAQLEAAQAKLKNAQVNLDYTRIHAPITGIIDRSRFTEGDLVGPDVGLLTSIVASDAMEVPFQVSEKAYWDMVRKLQKGEMDDSVRKPIVEIAFSENDIYEHQGTINFISNRVNPDTGSMEVRALVPNPDGVLKPGQYVTVNVTLPVPVDVIMVAQTAVQSDQQGDYVLTVDTSNTVQRKNIYLDRRVDTLVIVESGLDVGERVIIRGVQKVRDGMTVKAISADEDEQQPPSASVIKK
ncbi:efflux RND transporter periplasmic adaptor subunit [Thalassotalea ponticola]|uniref:efflux RND transporter periplasmic adaptor subunit n=1 Tax=Thalassotalea ponticola TaxID=1523392 RepID=UPI0025B56E7D|nr:efflux RND transporter periplasmic adaptor subunit [Thalassotalea ponticola]MDN3653233.1 efflux RND transporter periplasmic adaptor subunit [Thalassotalea ponticola]